MNNKWKRICKAGIAFILILCLSSGIFGHYLYSDNVEAASMPELSEYDVMTFADYGYEDGIYTENTGKTAAYRNNLNRVYFDGYITPTQKTVLFLGATVSGAQDGIKIQFCEGAIVVQGQYFYSNKVALGTEMRLGMSIDYIDADNDNSSNDIQVGIWIDGLHIGIHTFSDITDSLGAYLTVMVRERALYTVTMPGIASFFLSNQKEANGTVRLSYTVAETNAGTSVGNNGVVATTKPAERFPYDKVGSMKFNNSTNYLMKEGCTYTLELALDSGFVKVLSGSYTDTEGKNYPTFTDNFGRSAGVNNTDCKYFGIYIEKAVTATLTNVSCEDAAGNDLGLQSNQADCTIQKEETDISIRSANATELYENYKKVTFADFGIASENYSSQKTGTYDASSGTDTLDGAVLHTNVTMGKSAGFRYGGTNTKGYTGINLLTDASGNVKLRYVDNSTGGLLSTFTTQTLSGVSLSEGNDLVLSTKLIDADSDGLKDDVKIGLAIGDDFYKSYVAIDAKALGNYVCLGIDGGPISVNESAHVLNEGLYQRVTLLDIGVKDVANRSVEGGFASSTCDGVLFTVNLVLGDSSVFVYGAPLVDGARQWQGMYFYVENGTVKLKFNGISGYSIYTLSDIVVGEVFNLKITTDYVDFDSDGNKDDVKLGVWIDGALNQNKYIYLLDYVSYMNSGIVFYTPEGAEGAIASDILLSDVSYELEGSGYLITTSGSAKVTRNGQDYTVTNHTLTEAGEYLIVKTEEYSTITQKVTLYEGVSSDVPAVTYDYLGGDAVMPIAGYFGPYTLTADGITYNYVTDDIYQMIANSGINLINHSKNDYIGNSNVVLKQLRLAEKYNLGMYVSDFKLSNTTEEMYNVEYNNMTEPADLAERLGEYSYYDSFLGIHLWDEPYTDEYNLFSTAIFTQSDRYQRKLDSYLGISTALNNYVNLEGFINLLELGSKNNLINENGEDNIITDADEIAEAYDAYLDKAIEDGNLKYLSYDKYLFGNASSSVSNATGYFRNLSIISEKAEENQLPFWSYVQLGGDFSNRESSRKYAATDSAALPTEAETYWQINMPLAFGAKGIEYFTLVQPYYFSYDDTNGVDCSISCCNTTGDCGHSHDYNRCGLIGANGQPTIYYAYAQKANAQIQAVDEVLMKSTSKGVLAVGANAEANTTGLASMISVDETSALESVELSDSNDDGTIIGCFDYQGKDAFYVVNYDVENPQTITLKFADGETDYRVIQNAEESTGTAQKVALQIPQGESALVVLESTEKTAQYVFYEDISTYRNVDTAQNIAPTLDGYVFAGWFEEGHDAADSITTGTINGSAYAKFVDENLLNVKAQVRYYDVNAINKMDIRFVSTVDTKRYEKVGFVLEYNDKVVNTETKVVYNNLYAWDDNDYLTYVPTDLCKTAKHFITHTLKNVPIKNFNTPTKATAYWITQDGTTVMGESVFKTVYEGIKELTSPEAYGYATKLTINDFGVLSGTYKSDSLQYVSGSYTESLDATYLDVDIILPDNGNTTDGIVLNYAGSAAESGLCVFISNGYLCIQDAQGGDGKYTFKLEQYGIAANREFNLKISTKLQADETTLKVGIWFNDMLAGASFYEFTNFNGYGNMLGASGTSSDSITVRAPYKMHS